MRAKPRHSWTNESAPLCDQVVTFTCNLGFAFAGTAEEAGWVGPSTTTTTTTTTVREGFGGFYIKTGYFRYSKDTRYLNEQNISIHT